MANITLNIPDNILARVVDSIASEYNYNASTDGTKGEFAKKQVIEFLKRTVRDAEYANQAKSVRQTLEADINSNVVIS